MPALKQDHATLDELIAAHQGRLRPLQLQRARQGNDTPPHVLTEIEQIESEIVQLKQAAAVKVSDDLVEELGPTGRYQLWMSHIMRLDADIGRLARRVEQVNDKLDQVLIALGKRPRQPRKKASS